MFFLFFCSNHTEKIEPKLSQKKPIPSEVLANLRSTLEDYKEKMYKANAEVTIYKENVYTLFLTFTTFFCDKRCSLHK